MGSKEGAEYHSLGALVGSNVGGTYQVTGDDVGS